MASSHVCPRSTPALPAAHPASTTAANRIRPLRPAPRVLIATVLSSSSPLLPGLLVQHPLHGLLPLLLQRTGRFLQPPGVVDRLAVSGVAGIQDQGTVECLGSLFVILELHEDEP